MRLYTFAAVMVLATIVSVAPTPPAGAQTPSMTYPDTAKVDVTDDYHGRLVSDPYRWLEDTESAETAAWVAAQNDLTRRYLDSIPVRASIRRRLEKIWNYPRYGLPRRRGETYLYLHNDGLQNQSVLYKSTSLGGRRDVLIDPNMLSEDGTVALGRDRP